jgi:hypothetical protein
MPTLIYRALARFCFSCRTRIYIHTYIHTHIQSLVGSFLRQLSHKNIHRHIHTHTQSSAGSFLLQLSHKNTHTYIHTHSYTELGWLVSASIVAHELPQELADFGILVQAGLPVWQALLCNFFSSCSCFIGVFPKFYLCCVLFFVLYVVMFVHRLLCVVCCVLCAMCCVLCAVCVVRCALGFVWRACLTCVLCHVLCVVYVFRLFYHEVRYIPDYFWY